MNAVVRSIRFARATETAAENPSGTVVAHVILDERTTLSGRIVRADGAWHYELAGQAEAVITSSVSRQDLEHLVRLFHLGEVDAPPTVSCSAPPLAMTG